MKAMKMEKQSEGCYFIESVAINYKRKRKADHLQDVFSQVIVRETRLTSEKRGIGE